jgi:ATP phosphoribosyltransferase regulatory subunit
MTYTNRWLLPEGIEELMPNEAARLEGIRRDLLDLFKAWGYQHVIPPLVEYIDTLLTGAGSELNLQTFKLTDQISGRTMGVRADMTPQVTRMVSHRFGGDAPVRLSYIGSILQAQGAKIQKSRSPMQVGAELYGCGDISADVEVIQLMLEMLAISGLQQIHLDLGHVNIFRGLSKQAGLSEDQESALFEVLQRKAFDETKELLSSFCLEQKWQDVFISLLSLNGDVSVLEKAKKQLSIGDESVQSALQDLQNIADELGRYYPSLPLYFDLAELRCYQYQTGVVFAAFTPGVGSEVARGGRYDNIGEVFGKAQPATGFSADLKVLSRLSTSVEQEKQDIILAPDSSMDDGNDLYELIRNLRASGKTVIQELVGTAGQPDHSAVISKIDGKWVVQNS